MKSPRLSYEGLVPLEKVQDRWHRLSRRFFENRLPPISIEWSTRLTASAGMFVSRVGPRSVWVSREYQHGEARAIRLSAPLLRHQPEDEIWRTLAHEMIHQWQFDIRKHCPSHGPEFRDMMHRMNAEGLGITVRHRLETAVSPHRYVWQCVRCHAAYPRLRRSINPGRHMCGQCRGKLVEIPLNTESEKETGSFGCQLRLNF